MAKRFLAKLTFIAATLLMTVAILLTQNHCTPTDPNGGPMPNGTITGGYHTSPEEELVKRLVELFGKDITIQFFEGSIDGFVDFLRSIDSAFDYLDFVGFYSDDLDKLISENLMKPYPRVIDESDFLSEAILAMKRGNILYGVPIYILEDGRVKGVGVSSKVKNLGHEAIVVDLINFLTSFESSKAIAAIAGGTPARVN